MGRYELGALVMATTFFVMGWFLSGLFTQAFSMDGVITTQCAPLFEAD